MVFLFQPLRWCCVKCVIHHERDVREEQHHTYTWREQAIKEWSWPGSSADINLWLNVTTSVRGELSWHVNSVVACCRSAKLCAHAARDFRTQQHEFVLKNIVYIMLDSIKAMLEIQWFCLFVSLGQGFPTFSRSRSTWAPHIIKAYILPEQLIWSNLSLFRRIICIKITVKDRT